jgi:hypothetical protein
MSQRASDPTPAELGAFVDGELPPQEMARIATLIAARPDLEAIVSRQMRMRAQLAAVFAPPLQEPVPRPLQDAARNTPISWRARLLAQGRALRDRLASRWVWRIAIPAAATLALGLVAGVAIDRLVSISPLIERSPETGQMVAQGQLARVLNDQLASAGGTSQQAGVGISFRNRNGQDCRTFEVAGDTNEISGIACRAKGNWAIAALASQKRESNTSSAYQMAGSEMPDVIRKAVGAMIVGAPFDAQAERRARDRQWQGVP